MIVKKLVSIAFLVLGIVVLILGYELYDKQNLLNQSSIKILAIEKEFNEVKETLFTYTTFKNYSAVLSKSLSEQMKFIGAKAKRRYMHQEDINKSTITVKSYASIELIYDAEYAVGYDLSNGKFNLEATDNGFVLHLNRPEIVASPAATYTFTRILSGALFIDEKQEIINLLNKLPQILSAPERINGILNDAEVTALCEKKIKEFIRNVLISQYKVKMIPEIVIVYPQ